ncbi:hypothetical protein HYS94_05045 [Candidatus Daviesbacteria bacterium]|nr:hypothetical protein [Candidatus Daviesbacteria bacterium]
MFINPSIGSIRIKPTLLPRKKLILIVLGAILLTIIASLLFKNSLTSKTSNLTNQDVRFELPPPKARVDINREFTFPIKDSKGEEVGNIKYSVLNAELQDQIISKSKKYTTVKGRTILVLNLKITNEFAKSIQINTKDYIRLSTSSNTELLAADIHNDPVSIQAISTKFTRLAFPIYDTDKNLKLLVGEIGGAKEEVKINFN